LRRARFRPRPFTLPTSWNKAILEVQKMKEIATSARFLFARTAGATASGAAPGPTGPPWRPARGGAGCGNEAIAEIAMRQKVLENDGRN
jgi:hypothetical protein